MICLKSACHGKFIIVILKLMPINLRIKLLKRYKED